MYIYKIMNKNGLFSTGGMGVSFHEKGKEWKEKRHLISHLTQTIHCKNEEVYDGCFIVRCELKEIERQDIAPLLQSKKQELLDKEEKEKQIRQRQKERNERKQLAELSKKYKK